MERFTISLDARLAKEFDRLIRAKGYENRSEAVRDILRQQLEAHRLQAQEAPHCIASLSYVYNHHERDLAERMTSMQHRRHDLTVSTMHAHLDHDNCLETVILRGPTAEVRRFAEALIAERGVRHGRLNLIPADVEAGHHHHVHSRPKS
ncbi:MAG: nickel-responsive transcriptional regulator NikR [Pseudomonadota bacterium]